MAFTLIEMAVVLLVIGLIVGGILVGRNLIFSAAIRAQVSQINQISQGVNTFKAKYEAIPGDMNRNAARFGLFVNGYANDNNTIEDSAGNPQVHEANGEPQNFWQHLTESNVIPDTTLKGTNNVGAACRVKHFYSMSLDSQSGMMAQSYLGNIWVWLGVSNCAGTYTGAASPAGVGVMTPQQAFAMDSKMDDGIPSTGRILAFVWNFNNDLAKIDVNSAPTTTQCVNNGSATAYNLALMTKECRLQIKID